MGVGVCCIILTNANYDGLLQLQDRFDKADLEDEHHLLRRLFIHLRRGDLSGALELCGAHGQAL